MSLYINNTGIRDGERILGIGKQCKGSILRVIKGFYPPSKAFFNELLIRDRFGSFSFFHNMSVEDRIQYIFKYGTDNKDLYMDDVDITVKFEVMSGEYFSKYSTICNELISRGPISIREAFDMFPKNPGSRARKHTLVFRPSNWTLMEDIIDKTNMDCMDIMNGTILNAVPNYIIDGIGYIISSGTTLITGRSVLPEMKWYTPSFLKSLIQKIIRTRATTVRFPNDVVYSGIVTLHSAITCLLEHPGSFVPNIQKFVKGSESCFKRLAVTIVEDSYIERSHNIYILLMNALLLQREPSYIPSRASIELLYTCSEQALESKYCYSSSASYQCDLSWFPLCSHVLHTIGSFESDVKMFNTYNGVIYGSSDGHEMNVWHAVDHHCYTDIGWFCNMDNYESYSELFRDIWERSSKYNPRRNLLYDDAFNQAQMQCYMFHMPYVEVPKGQRTATYRIKYKLHEDFLYSVIGTMYYSNYIVTRLGSSIARKPRRDDPNYVKLPITDDEKRLIELYVADELRKGIRRKLPGYSEVTILNDKIEWNGELYRWNDMRTISMLIGEGQDIKEGHMDTIRKIRSMPYDIKKRLFMYMNTWRDKIELHRIGRDGTGTKYSVSKLDSHVFQILMELSHVLPGCIKFKEGNIHITKDVMYWYFRDLIFKDRIHVLHPSQFKYLDVDQRTLYGYQQDCLDRLIETRTHGSILWIDVGMGKTLIVMSYIKYLIDNGTMTEYCCYLLPPSALDSIKKEIELAGIKYNVLDMRKGSINTILEPNVINILYHDHLRLGDIADQLRQISDNLTLIVDEFHLCLSSTTIRTSLTLEIAKLSHRFIAMSGTILNSIDSIDDMIEWLELTVPYPVNKHNYQVAISELISFDTKLEGINIIREDIQVQLGDKELEYRNYVPKSIGGNSNRLHFQDALKVCYDAVIPAMAQYAIDNIANGPIFIVMYNNDQQVRMSTYLSGYKVHLITHDSPLTLKKNDTTDIQFIITTMKHSAGYTLTKCHIMLTSVYPSNEANRTQIEGRLMRLGQDRDVNIITFHTGILSYMLDKHRKTGNMNKVLKELGSM